MTIGVIGLGIIGAVWARHYENAGRLVAAWNRTPRPGAPKWESDLKAVAEKADAVQIVVADPPAVQQIIDTILPALNSRKIVIQSSTIDPESSERLHAQVTATGARYLEAPFTGSKPAAENREVIFYLGGEATLISELDPLLSIISKSRITIGTPRQACTLKLSMNLNVAAQMQVLCEALSLSRRAGIGDDIFFAALAKNVSHSGLADLKGPKLRASDYAPQFSVKHMLKDMRLATKAAGGETHFPILDRVRQCLLDAQSAGLGDEDFSALMKLLR